MSGLPLELALLVAGFVQSTTARLSTRDLSSRALCSGKYAPLNANDLPPGTIYELIKDQCPHEGQSLLDVTACDCTLATYNLRQASSYCDGENPWSWSKWANNYSCNNNTSPPAQPPIDLKVELPDWATQALSTSGNFDVNAALATASKGSNWGTVQIIVPIVVGVSVALIALLFFLWYRHRTRKNGSRYAKNSQNRGLAWQSPNLHGHRRIFGLFPDRPTVRPRGKRDSNWSIDEVPQTMHESIELSNAPGYNERNHAGHSRSESATSLLSSPSRKSNTSWFSAITNFLPSGKAYQSGTAKGPGYSRVRVVHSPNPSGIDLEGEPYDPPEIIASPPSVHSANDKVSSPGNASVPVVPPTQDPTPSRQQRQDSLPSFVDIRRQSTDLDSRHATRDSTLPTPPSLTVMHKFKHTARVDSRDSNVLIMNGEGTSLGMPPTSEFSLGTSDLTTPTTTDSPSLPFAMSPRQISAASPFLPRPSNRAMTSMPEEHHSERSYNPHTLMFRNPSTDTLAFPVYPRDRTI